ncbi:MAG: MBL fold metallo-hydrolase [Candidatus Bostrichicola ureolyticus]|nr:MAG: MBL fold metallo-hydrolase [Candidatus Bostrichicola ureolyticus]
MKITFLGTGTSQGIPVIGLTNPICFSTDFKDKRLRSSILIKKKNTNILIDCGPDFRYQMLRSKNNNIDAILLTHEHNDHISGLDDIYPINKKKIYIYGLPRTLEILKKRFFYFFSEEKKFNVQLINIETYITFSISNIEIMPLLIMHGKLPILGYRINNIAYITDANFIPNETINKLKGLEILILNSLRKKPKHKSHFILSESLKLIEILKPKKTYLTHISHLLGFHAIVEQELPNNIYLAYDGLILNL